MTMNTGLVLWLLLAVVLLLDSGGFVGDIPFMDLRFAGLMLLIGLGFTLGAYCPQRWEPHSRPMTLLFWLLSMPALLFLFFMLASMAFFLARPLFDLISDGSWPGYAPGPCSPADAYGVLPSIACQEKVVSLWARLYAVALLTRGIFTPWRRRRRSAPF